MAAVVPSGRPSEMEQMTAFGVIELQRAGDRDAQKSAEASRMQRPAAGLESSASGSAAHTT
jgi:hypothetical protein